MLTFNHIDSARSINESISSRIYW